MIGSADLRIYDRSMGVIGGIFEPTSNYNAIRQQIQLTTLQNDLLDKPLIIAQAHDDIILESVAGVKIQDYPEFEPEITVLGLHWQIIERYFGDLPDEF
ncbi:hypothetical protein ACP8Y2_15835 [Herpetosiphon llansteffanensis]